LPDPHAADSEEGRGVFRHVDRACLALARLRRVHAAVLLDGLAVFGVNTLDQLEDDELPKGKAKRVGRALNREEIGRLLAHAVPSYRPILATLVLSGLRMQEALGLQWQDVDFEANLILLRYQLSRATRTEPGRRLGLKAKGSARDIRLLPELRALLLEHKLASSYSQPDDFVFATETGSPMYHRNVATRGLDKAADRAGLNPEG
jgi:integrase